MAKPKTPIVERECEKCLFRDGEHEVTCPNAGPPDETKSSGYGDPPPESAVDAMDRLAGGDVDDEPAAEDAPNIPCACGETFPTEESLAEHIFAAGEGHAIVAAEPVEEAALEDDEIEDAPADAGEVPAALEEPCHHAQGCRDNGEGVLICVTCGEPVDTQVGAREASDHDDTVDGKKAEIVHHQPQLPIPPASLLQTLSNLDAARTVLREKSDAASVAKEAQKNAQSRFDVCEQAVIEAARRETQPALPV